MYLAVPESSSAPQLPPLQSVLLCSRTLELDMQRVLQLERIVVDAMESVVFLLLIQFRLISCFISCETVVTVVWFTPSCRNLQLSVGLRWILLSPFGNALSIPDSMQFPFFSLLPGFLTLRLMDSFDAGNTR